MTDDFAIELMKNFQKNLKKRKEKIDFLRAYGIEIPEKETKSKRIQNKLKKEN